MDTLVVLEHGTDWVFASAVDWPGWARRGRGADAAVDELAAYADRYSEVCVAAGVVPPDGDLEVVEIADGTGPGPDFGVPDQPAELDDRPMDAATAGHLADLLAACWATFDTELERGAELSFGPRGGGRDHARLEHHVLDAEIRMIRKVDVVVPRLDAKRAEPVPPPIYRSMVLDRLRAARYPWPTMTASRSAPWPWRFAARRLAWHALDHAWELQDRALDG